MTDRAQKRSAGHGLSLLKLLVSLVTLVYPFLVYFGLDALQPRHLALLLAVVFSLRWLQQGSWAPRSGLYWAAPLGLVLLVFVALSNEGTLLLGYPVMVSALFLAVFWHSLRNPPSFAEMIARIHEPDLPPRAVHYTRKVTQVWCVFFLLNGIVAAGTVLYGDRWLWSLYNGFISYVLIGLLMGGELLVRRRFRGAP